MSLTQIAIAIVAIALVVLIVRGRTRASSDAPIRVADIPAVFAQLKKTGSDGSFAVFMPAPEPDSDDALNIQFSIENGTIGLDWVLLSPVNVRDQDKFKKAADELRFRYRETEKNGVRYLRTEDGRADELCVKLLSEVYGLSDHDSVDLIAEDFEWPAQAVG